MGAAANVYTNNGIDVDLSVPEMVKDIEVHPGIETYSKTESYGIVQVIRRNTVGVGNLFAQIMSFFTQILSFGLFAGSHHNDNLKTMRDIVSFA